MSCQSSTDSSVNLIEIPSFYHKQWDPHYPPVVLFAYNGCSYPIKLRKDHNKDFFANGLKQFRKELNIQEGITITYVATDQRLDIQSSLHATLDYQTCGRPPTTRRTHVWTIEVLPTNALAYVGASTQNMTILTNDAHPLVWKLTIYDPKTSQQCVADPWYRYLKQNDFSPGDELCFYFRPKKSMGIGYQKRGALG
ncbi:hypothetical protein JHK87_052830 [Glycine soja]|nr:hypothetical protein JHK87_052830 [Glycine soja]